MPVSSYGAYNPAAVDPWPIEQTLAPLATAGSSANAQRMLGDYQNQRQIASNIYGMELDKQHQFNRDQLAQQLYEAKLKEVPSLLNAPGGAHLLGAGGIPGMDMGTDPTTLQGVIGAADMANASKNFQAAGQGYNQFAQGGLQVNPQQVPGMAGVQGDVTGPALVRAALIRAQQSAANNASRGARESGVTLSGVTPMSVEGDQYNISQSKIPLSKVAEAIAQRDALAAELRARRRGTTTGGSTSDATGGGSGSSLPPNQQTATKPTGGGTALDTNSPNGQMAQGGATIMVDRDTQSSDPVKQRKAADIKAGMRSATAYDTHMGPDGKAYVRGASKSYYPIQN